MVQLAVAQEIREVVIIVRHLLEGEVLPKRLPQVKYFAVLSLVLFQQCAVDLPQLGNFCHCSHPDIGIAQFVAHRIVFHVEGRQIAKGRNLVEDNWFGELAGLD